MNTLPDAMPVASFFYAPPYETPAHEEFAWHAVKVLDPDCGLAVQAPFVTDAGPVWVDFVVETTLPDGRMRRVGFELTGADEHEDQTASRDALLVTGGSLHALYRVQASDVFTRLFDILCVVADREPALFSMRGRINIERLAHPDVLLASPASALACERHEGCTVEEFVHDPAPGAARVAAWDDFDDQPAPRPSPLRIRRVRQQAEAAW